MSLEPFLKEFFKTPEAIETCRILRLYASQCDTFIEFGSRGGITAIAILQALVDKKKQYKPRYLGVDLIHDETILKISEIADKIGVSFQFWQGHTEDFPLLEADGLLWDTFHCAGNLLKDLNSLSAFIHKFIIIIGTKVDGINSEAVRRSLDFEMVSKELRIPMNSVEQGLEFAIDEFLKKNSSWIKEFTYGDITILKRTVASKQRLYS